MNGLCHFLAIQGYGCNNPGGPLIVIGDFLGVSILRYIFPGDKLAAEFTFFGVAQAQTFFQVSFFSEGLNCLRLNSRGFMSRTIILSRLYCYWFLKIWSSMPLKNGIAHYYNIITSIPERFYNRVTELGNVVLGCW